MPHQAPPAAATARADATCWTAPSSSRRSLASLHPGSACVSRRRAGAGSGSRPDVSPRCGWDRRRMFKALLVAVGLIALHVADDNLLQPQPGTSAGDHLIPALVPLAVLALAAWAFPRLRAGAQGALALVLAPFGVIAGAEAMAYSARVGPSGDDFTGLLAVPAGVTLLVLGTLILWRSRRTEDRHVWRYGRRLALTAGGVVVVVMAIFPLALAYMFTHVAPAPGPPRGRSGPRHGGWWGSGRQGGAAEPYVRPSAGAGPGAGQSSPGSTASARPANVSSWAARSCRQAAESHTSTRVLAPMTV